MFDWITSLIDSTGLLGIAILMFVENVFPPIPSEVIMPLAGFNAARGGESLVGVILAGSLGSLAGAWFWYWVGQRVGIDRLKRLSRRHGRWLTLTPDQIDEVSDWFRKKGQFAVLIGRVLPGLRTLISVPAGVARMPLWLFLFWSALGTLVWVSLLAIAGYALESQYARVAHLLDPISTGVVASMIAYYFWRVWRFDPGT